MHGQSPASPEGGRYLSRVGGGVVALGQTGERHPWISFFLSHRLSRPSSKRCSPQPTMRRRRTSRRTGSGWDAGYKAPVEKWDTDSDSSDGSDDELDLAV